MRTSVCMWPCGCMLPPITPKLMTGAPSLVRKAGMMVWNGRLPGATRFGLHGSSEKPWPRFCIDTPQPGTTTPEPKPM